MADISLVNSVSVNGTYDAEPLILTSNTLIVPYDKMKECCNM